MDEIIAVPNKILRRTLRAMPKIDLHRHLEGRLRLSTLADIANQHGMDIQSLDIEELRPLVQVVDDQPDFQGFLAKFDILRKFYNTREAVLRIAYEVVADAAQDNVKYLELRFNFSMLLRLLFYHPLNDNNLLMTLPTVCKSLN